MKSVLAKVELGEVDAGVVYVTDVRAAGDKVKGIAIPAKRQRVHHLPDRRAHHVEEPHRCAGLRRLRPVGSRDVGAACRRLREAVAGACAAAGVQPPADALAAGRAGSPRRAVPADAPGRPAGAGALDRAAQDPVRCRRAHRVAVVVGVRDDRHRRIHRARGAAGLGTGPSPGAWHERAASSCDAAAGAAPGRGRCRVVAGARTSRHHRRARSTTGLASRCRSRPPA